MFVKFERSFITTQMVKYHDGSVTLALPNLSVDSSLLDFTRESLEGVSISTPLLGLYIYLKVPEKFPLTLYQLLIVTRVHEFQWCNDETQFYTN